ncbi:hypothetical protein SLA2020_242290 [Shorea laevis]
MKKSKEGITPVNSRSHILWWFNVEWTLEAGLQSLGEVDESKHHELGMKGRQSEAEDPLAVLGHLRLLL